MVKCAFNSMTGGFDYGEYKKRETVFGVFSLVITTCIANSSVPDSQAKKKKQTITILNKKKKGVLTIRAGKKVQLKVKVNGKKVPRKKMKKNLKFKSSNTKVLLVSKKGQLFAKKAGKTTVTVTQKGKKKKTQLKVKVLPKNTSQNRTKLPTETAIPTVVADTTPIVTVKPMVTNTVTVTPTVKPTATAGPIVGPTPVISATPTATAGPIVGPTPVISAKPTATAGPIVDPTPVISAKPTATADPTPVISAMPTATVPAAPTATVAATAKPTATAGPTPVISATPTATATPISTPTPEPELVSGGDCYEMVCGGSYAGQRSDLSFSAIALYGNGDYCSTSYDFTGTNKKYRMVVKGASDNSSTASVSVYIGGKKVGAASFTGTSLSEQSFDFKMTDVTGKQEIKFLLETDNGSNDTYVNSYELYYIGDIPETPKAPVPATKGAAYTGKYRNLFKEYGYSEDEINEKVESTWEKLFYGNDDERLYYPVGDDMAYIYTADTDDVRSEGMSYGMMICVQMDKKKEFNRLWKWAKTYMQHTDGEYKGYFAWKMKTNGTKIDNTPASDGEEYFATALLFASVRWGNGEGIYNYRKEAQEILTTMLHQADDGQGVNMFDSTHKMPVFCPIGSAATYTDPSYHLPAFYEVWALEADRDNEFWSEAAKASRKHFKEATNASTGLAPDYSEYSGAAKKEGNHDDFRFDAWRTAANIACDYAWWAKDDWAVTHANRLQSFFYGKGVESYGNQWTLDGKTEYSTDHSPGLVAMNATAGLAASTQNVWAFVEDLWNISPTTGTYRYYDGCLYMMGLLHCSGNFRVYLSKKPPKPVVNGKISTTEAEFDLKEKAQTDITTNLILNGERRFSKICNGNAELEQGMDYTIDGDKVTILKRYLAKQSVGITTLTFVFDAGDKATLTITIKNSTTGETPAVTGPFNKIQAISFEDSKNITVSGGKVIFNSTDSYIAFTLDFGSEKATNVAAYVKEPNNSGQLFIRNGSLSTPPTTVYNLGNGSWKEVSSSLNPNLTGKTTIYIQTNKPDVELEWVQFMK